MRTVPLPGLASLPGVQLLPEAAAAREYVAGMDRIARVEVLKCSTIRPERHDDTALRHLEEMVDPNLRALRRGRKQLTVGHTSSLGAPRQRHVLATLHEAGDRHRVVEDSVGLFLVADRRTVVLGLESEAAGGALVVQHPQVVRAYVALFASLWRRGQDLSAPGPEPDPVLALVAEGLTDEAVAERLGLSARTVRRHVARLMEVSGSCSRFQLGMWFARQSAGPVVPGPAERG